jgi:hypothetical protein
MNVAVCLGFSMWDYKVKYVRASVTTLGWFI